MERMPIVAGMTGSAFIAAINNNFELVDNIIDEAAHVYPVEDNGDSGPSINTAFETNSCVVLHGVFFISTTITIPDSKTLTLAVGSVVHVTDQVDGIRMKTKTSLEGNNGYIICDIENYSKTLVRINPADNVTLLTLKNLNLTGISNCGIGIGIDNDDDYTGSTERATKIRIDNVYTSNFEKGLSIDIKQGTGYITAVYINKIYFNEGIYGLYINDGEDTGSTKAVFGVFLMSGAMQACSETKVCYYINGGQCIIHAQTYDVPICSYALVFGKYSATCACLFEELNPVLDLGSYNRFETTNHFRQIEANHNEVIRYYLEGQTLQLIGDTGALSPVTEWTDQSIVENNATEATNPPALIEDALNGLSVIRCTGSELLTLDTPITCSRKGAFIAIVFKLNTLDAIERKLFDDGAGNTLYFTNDSTSTLKMVADGDTEWVSAVNKGFNTTDWNVMIICAGEREWSGYTENTVEAFLNGSNTPNKISTNYPAKDFVISKLFCESFCGDIAELLVYNSLISITDKTNIFKYLNDKYDLGFLD